jgi:hypothetical protein
VLLSPLLLAVGPAACKRTSLAGRKDPGEVSMVPASEFSAHIKQARLAVDSALALAEVVARNDIVECASFNQMVAHLHDAIELLAKAEVCPTEPTVHDSLTK